MPLEIIYADDRLIAVSKPSGLLSVPGRGPDKQDSLFSRLQAEWPDALLVHRLDRDTSGIVLFARDAETQRMLARQFQERTVEKRYVALVAGAVVNDFGRLTLPLARDLANPPCYRVDYFHGLTAVTDYRVLIREAMQTRVELVPHTGRSHQLRVHMRELGHPILGDPLYAPPSVIALARRLCLHGSSIEVECPDGKRQKFTCADPF